MIRIVNYAERRPGDVAFVHDDSVVSRAIQEAEAVINPITTEHFWIPSHVLVFGPEPGQVTEAFFGEAPAVCGTALKNSAVALNPESKYDGWFERGQMQVWRCAAAADICKAALISLREALAKDPYSVANLIGFGLEALTTWLSRGAKKIENPIDSSFVCSQVALGQILAVNAYSGAEAWAAEVDERNCTPDSLLSACAGSRGK